MRWIATAFALLFATPAMAAQTCTLDFTIEVTQGVGLIRPGTQLPGHAEFTTHGQSIRQEGGSTGHLAMGNMRIGDDIAGNVWTLITTSRGNAADLVGLYARDVQGLSYGGLDYEGPMALTLVRRAGIAPQLLAARHTGGVGRHGCAPRVFTSRPRGGHAGRRRSGPVGELHGLRTLRVFSAH